MSIAYWCILIAAVLPFVWVGVAKSGAARLQQQGSAGLDRQAGHLPRPQCVQRPPQCVRGVPDLRRRRVDGAIRRRRTRASRPAAIAFIGFRILHGVFYVARRQRCAAWSGWVALPAPSRRWCWLH